METLGYGSGVNSYPTEVKFEEDWIARKLWDRCMQYKKRYPGFDAERLYKDVSTWSRAQQRRAPYMTDKDIQTWGRHRRFDKGMSRIND